MQSDATQSDNFIRFVAWVQANQKRLIIGTAIVLIAVAVVSFITYEQGQKEIRASRALANVPTPANFGTAPRPGTAEAYLKVAKDFEGTKAAARALLQAGAAYFTEGKHADAQRTFEQFLKEYPTSQWVTQAHYGIAASLDAQGKGAEAVAKFEEIRKRFANDATIDEVKLALGRLYENQNKPGEAHKLYTELVQANPYSGIGSEAGVRKEDLEEKFPDLAKTNAPLTTMPTPMPLAASTNPPASTNRVITLTNTTRAATNIVTQAATNVQKTVTNAPLLLQQQNTNTAKP